VAVSRVALTAGFPALVTQISPEESVPFMVLVQPVLAPAPGETTGLTALPPCWLKSAPACWGAEVVEAGISAPSSLLPAVVGAGVSHDRGF
jgi:hypothetical protein